MANSIWGDITADLGDEMAHLVKEELLTGWNAKSVMAGLEQKRIAEANARLQECAVEGLGQHVMDIDADVYWAWESVEPGCWADKKWRDDFKKRHPETAVTNYTPRAATVLVP
jgi:hypothetical protein